VTASGPSSFARPATPVAPKPGRPRLRAGLLILAALLALGVAAAMAVVVVVSLDVKDAPQIPSQEALWTIRRSPGVTFLDRNGAVIATRGAKYGAPVRLADLPAYVPKAFLAAEDRRFYRHGPIDVVAIARAALADLRAGRSAEGASTLSQQLARTLFLKRERSLKRKVQEAYLAWRLEQSLGKDQVLELYLNRTYFGDGAYGLDAAAKTYFGKPASQLSLVEAATLAGLPNAPTRLALTNAMPAALARAHRILEIMGQEGWITPSDLRTALAQTPTLAPQSKGEGDEGYVLDQAAAEAWQLTGGQTPDLVIRTTIDPALQAAGAQMVRGVVLKEGARRNVSQGALVTLAPDGAILAMVGGLDHDLSPFNRVTQAKRQPGSSFKAFVYGAAVERGATAREVRLDGPISIGGWSPQNYGHSYLGPVTLQEALARSLNTVSVRLTLEVGPDTVADFAHRLGLSDIPFHPGPSIALGAYEVTPLELAAGYQVFQDGGQRTTPYLVSEIRSTRGDLLYARSADPPASVLDPLFATRMVGMLEGVITSGTGMGANIGRPAAGKTGTSQDWRDAWFVGFTPDLLTVVWVGNDNGAPMAKVTGGELPAEIWKKFMTVALKGTPPRDFPWLVPEPAAPPVTNVVDPSLDQPPSTADDGETVGGPTSDATIETDGPDDPDAEPPSPRHARAPADDDDDPGPPPRPPRGWRRPPPPDGDDDVAPSAPGREDGGPYPDSPADRDPRYRY
jgi:penicillin-binding protein 1A